MPPRIRIFQAGSRIRKNQIKSRVGSVKLRSVTPAPPPVIAECGRSTDLFLIACLWTRAAWVGGVRRRDCSPPRRLSQNQEGSKRARQLGRATRQAVIWEQSPRCPGKAHLQVGA